MYRKSYSFFNLEMSGDIIFIIYIISTSKLKFGLTSGSYDIQMTKLVQFM